MPTKEEYWTAREDIENEKRAKIKDLNTRYTYLNTGIGQNTEAYEKAKYDVEVGYNSNLKALNEEFGVEPKRMTEDGSKYIERINTTLGPEEGQNE